MDVNGVFVLGKLCDGCDGAGIDGLRLGHEGERSRVDATEEGGTREEHGVHFLFQPTSDMSRNEQKRNAMAQWCICCVRQKIYKKIYKVQHIKQHTINVQK